MACTAHHFEWLSPRNSLSGPEPDPITASRVSDSDFIDFEFRIHDPISMLPADELFSEGKLIPLHLSKPKPSLIGSGSKLGSDIFAVSPKAPTCTSRWRELLRRKQRPADPGANPKPASLKQMLSRKSASSVSDPSNVAHPLLTESEARISSSSDSDPKPKLGATKPPRGRAGRSPARRSAAPPPVRCSSVDSPRMTASGKVVFQGLGRSASSPSTFGGGGGGPQKNRYNGMRVINVPVPSVSAFGFRSGAGSKSKN